MSRKTFFQIFRLSLLTITSLALGILLLGPFAGQETRLNLTDKEAHIFAFYFLTMVALFTLKTVRKLDILFAIVAIAALSEAIQIPMGRNGDVTDWLADVVGALGAVLPLYSRENAGKSRRKDTSVAMPNEQANIVNFQ